MATRFPPHFSVASPSCRAREHRGDVVHEARDEIRGWNAAAKAMDA